MAEKKTKTAQKPNEPAGRSNLCPNCGAGTRVTYFTGFGRKGLFWACEKDCGYIRRTR